MNGKRADFFPFVFKKKNEGHNYERKYSRLLWGKGKKGLEKK